MTSARNSLNSNDIEEGETITDYEEQLEDITIELMEKTGFLGELRCKILDFIRSNGKIENMQIVQERINPEILHEIATYLNYVGLKNTCTTLVSESPIPIMLDQQQNEDEVPQIIQLFEQTKVKKDNVLTNVTFDLTPNGNKLMKIDNKTNFNFQSDEKDMGSDLEELNKGLDSEEQYSDFENESASVPPQSLPNSIEKSLALELEENVSKKTNEENEVIADQKEAIQQASQILQQKDEEGNVIVLAAEETNLHLNGKADELSSIAEDSSIVSDISVDLNNTEDISLDSNTTGLTTADHIIKLENEK